MRTGAAVLCVALVGCSSSSGDGGNGAGSGEDAGGADAAILPRDDSGTPADGGGPPADAGVDAAPPPDAGGDGAVQAFALTSSALAEGATFATANTCDGANTSPPFHWEGAPSGAQSFAIVLTDKTNGLVHWAIYDIGAQLTDAPAAILAGYQPPAPAGSKQAKNFNGVAVYAGPCPPQGQAAHTYEFALYAVNVAQLPGTTANTTKEQIVTLLGANNAGVAKLTGKYGR